jgi:hypothetical protein
LEPDSADDGARYCQSCGASIPVTAYVCPACGAPRRVVALPENVASLVALLNTVAEWHREGLLDEASAVRIREHLEGRLHAIAPRAQARPREPRPAASQVLAAWASERQADILLYLGAFLLVIAAVIFVTYQGEALGAAVRVALLVTYTFGFIVAGIVVRRWAVVREAGRVFLALGALVTPLNFVLLYVEVLDDRGVSGDLVWLIASVYTTVFYGALEVRGFGRLYALLARVAGLSGWGALAAVVGFPSEWVAAWFMALATATVISLAALDRLTRLALWGLGIVAGLSALTAIAAASSDAHHWQLPVTFALLASGMGVAGWDRRKPFALPVVATTALAAVLAAVWAAGADRAWGVYPVLALGAAAVVTRRWWIGWSAGLARFGWAYAGLAALAPLSIVSPGEPSWHAAVAFFAGATILASVAWLNRRLGMLGTLSEEAATSLLERVFFGWAAFAMLLGSVGHTNWRLGVDQPDTGWPFLTLALGVLVVLAMLGRRRVLAELLLLPPALAATFVGLQPPEIYPGHDAVLLGLTAGGLAVTAGWARRWVSLLAGALVAAAAAAAAWSAFDWATWTLALAYTATGAAVFAVLSPHRRYKAKTDAEIPAVASVVALSWAGAVGGPLTAAIAVQQRVDAEVVSAVATVEYRALTALVLAVAPLLVVEGWRLREPRAFVAASAVVLVAALMAIGIAEPDNVQAYTVPIGLYLIVLGIVVRRSSALWRSHLYLHEAIQFAGAAVLVLPQAEQSFDPGGARWGFILIAEGALFLTIAFTLGARWMAVAGVLTLSGVALRWLAESGDTIPYWLTLGVAGLALLLLGVFLLLRRDWWADIRHRTAGWWVQAPGPPA